MVLCKDVTVLGVQTAISVGHLNAQNWAFDVDLSNVTAATIRIEINQGGNKFGSDGILTHVCSATEISEGIAQFVKQNIPAKNMRAYIETLTGVGATISEIRVRGI